MAMGTRMDNKITYREVNEDVLRTMLKTSRVYYIALIFCFGAASVLCGDFPGSIRYLKVRVSPGFRPLTSGASTLRTSSSGSVSATPGTLLSAILVYHQDPVEEVYLQERRGDDILQRPYGRGIYLRPYGTSVELLLDHALPEPA